MISIAKKFFQIGAGVSADRVISATFWNLIATLCAKGIPVLSMIVVARILTQPEYGELGVIQSTIMMLAAFAAAGMGVTAATYISAKISSDFVAVGRVIGLTFLTTGITSLFLGMVFYFSAPWLAQETLSNSGLESGLQIGAILLAVNGWVNAQTGILSGFESFKTIATNGLLSNTVMVPVLIVGCVYFDVNGVLVGLCAGSVTNLILNYVSILSVMKKHNVRVTLNLSSEDFSILWHFSLPALLGGVVIGPALWVGAASLVNSPGGFTEMGIYTASYQWFSILLFIPSVVSSAILPVCSSQKYSNSKSELKETMLRGVKMVSLAVFPVGIIGIYLSSYIMGLYGTNYSSGWPVMVLVILAAMIGAFLSLIGNLFAVSNKMWIHFSSNLIWCIAYITAVLYFLDGVGGAVALAGALFVAYGVKAIYTMVVIFSYVKGYRS